MVVSEEMVPSVLNNLRLEKDVYLYNHRLYVRRSQIYREDHLVDIVGSSTHRI